MTQREFTIQLPDIPARATIELETTTRVFADGSSAPPVVERWTSRCLDCGRVIRADGRCGCFWRTRDQWLARHFYTFGLVGALLNLEFAIFGFVQLTTGYRLNPDRIAECQLLAVINLAVGAWMLHLVHAARRARRER